jgi:hypothetical protein
MTAEETLCRGGDYAEAGFGRALPGGDRDLFGRGGVGIVSPAWELRCQRLPAVTFAVGVVFLSWLWRAVELGLPSGAA